MKNSSYYAYILLAFSPLMWSGNFIAGRVMHAEIPPFALSFYRWALVVIILLPFVIKQLPACWPRIKRNWLALSFLSLFAMAINSPAFYLGLHFTTVINASLVYSTVPAFILLLSWIILKESLTGLKLIAIVISILGIVIIMTQGHPSLLLKLQFDKGDLAILLAAVAWAIFSVYLKVFRIDLPPIMFLFVTSVIGSIVLFPAFLIEQYLGYHAVWSLQAGAGLFYASAFSSVLGFTSWNLGIAKKGPAIAGYFFNLLPVYSTILAVLLLGEQLHIYHVFGISFVLLGILLVNFSK
ncbi:MAG: eamA 1 [Gammaproteobacteria bacterium]|jgi:drug/metabolite transporter (DMT)-like permease|nr:eamA 1 [Gammaproteobacteria bacterium]